MRDPTESGKVLRSLRAGGVCDLGYPESGRSDTCVLQLGGGGSRVKACVVHGIPFCWFPPDFCFLITLFACSVFQGSGLGTMELAVASTEVRPRPSQEEIEQATWWLFQAWLVTMVMAFMLGAVCWHRCGPRLCQWRQEWGRQHRSLWKLWQELGNRREAGGLRSREETVSTTPLESVAEGSTHTEAGVTTAIREPERADRIASPISRPALAPENQEGWTFPSPGGSRSRQVRTRAEGPSEFEREDLTKSSGGNNAGGGEPGLEPNQTDGRAKRGAIRIATEKARCPVWVAQARKRLRGKFFSANTAASKNSKRNKVWEIAKVVAPSEAVLPLCVDALEATAATLLESGLQAADQYLGELKAMHIEEGHWWSDKLNHHVTMCKRALSRGKGPEKRAKELKSSTRKLASWISRKGRVGPMSGRLAGC